MAAIVHRRIDPPPGVSGNFSVGSSVQVISLFRPAVYIIALYCAQFWRF